MIAQYLLQKSWGMTTHFSRIGAVLTILVGLLGSPSGVAKALPVSITTILVSGAHSSVFAVNSNTNRAYVGDFDNGVVSVIDITTNIVVATIPGLKVTVIDGTTNTASTIGGLGSHPISLAVDAVTNRVYVANQLSNNVSVINGATN